MASAGRILIMPKGAYDSSATYEMLDLVFHNGVSWLAKKTVIGIEPSVSNGGYWFKLCESTDLTELNNAITELGTSINILTASLSALQENCANKTDLEAYLKLSGGDLTGQLGFSNGRGLISGNDYGTYLQAKKDSNNYRNIRVDNPLQASSVEDWLKLVDCSNGTTKQYKVFGEHNIELLKTLISASVSGVKFYTGTNNRQNTDNVVTFSCTFPPKLILVIGKPTASQANYNSFTIIIPEKSVGITLVLAGSMNMGIVTATTNGNNVTITHTDNANMAGYYTCNSASMTYPYICIG